MDEAWNDKFPPLNLYNHPSFGVQDVFWEARKLDLRTVLPGEWVQAVLHGKENNNE